MQPRMTQVPPMRLSSATSVLAPWPAAIRAALTPPDPAPMTKKSTSKAMVDALRRATSILELDALLLHFLTRAHNDVRRQLVAPGRLETGEPLQKNRGYRDIFLARWTVEERGDIGKLLLGHFRREQRRRLVVCLPRRRVEFGLNRLQGRAQRILDFRPGPGDVGFELRHHAGNDERNRLLDADVAEDLVGGGDGGWRRRGRRVGRSRRSWRGGGGSGGRGGLLGACRHGHRREHEQGDRAIGGSDGGGHERLLRQRFELQSGSPRT